MNYLMSYVGMKCDLVDIRRTCLKNWSILGGKDSFRNDILFIWDFSPNGKTYKRMNGPNFCLLISYRTVD